jgi:hypothetical protein
VEISLDLLFLTLVKCQLSSASEAVGVAIEGLVVVEAAEVQVPMDPTVIVLVVELATRYLDVAVAMPNL